MKKILSVILLISLILSMLALAVSAETLSDKEEIKSMVVFGDSISTGYGLEGTVYTRASYANLVAQALGLGKDNGYVNYAVDGDTSSDIFNVVKQYSSDVEGADLILLSCGGNDILRHALTIAIATSGSNSTNLVQVALSLLSKTEDEVKAGLYSEKNEAIIIRALTDYRSNMEELVAYLKSKAPKARIVFLTQYNPLSGVPIGTVLDAYAEDVIGRLNAIMTETVLAGGCEIVDTHAVMVGQGMALSNIMASDIHPNTSGHAAMAEMVKAYLGIEDPISSETTVTTTVPDTVMTTDPAATTTAATTTAITSSETSKVPSVTTTTVSYTTTVALAVTTTEPAETSTAVSESEAASSAEEGQTSLTEEPKSEQTDVRIDEPEAKGTSALVIVIGAVLLFIGIAGTVFALVVRKK